MFLARSGASSLLPLLLSARPRVASRTLGAVASASTSPKRVVFLGTPAVAARSLELLLAGSRAGRGGGFELAAVVSQPPQRAGRKMKLKPSPVHQLAEAEGLHLLTPPNAKDDAFLSALEEMEPDLCVTAAYGCFLPQRFLDIPAKGTLNIHPSLLPLYRGAAPVQRCLEAGDEQTGVSVAFTVLAMDAGPIVRQTVRRLDGNEQSPELLTSLFEEGSELLLDALPSVWDGTVEMTPQDGDAATKAAKIDRAEAQLDFSELSARVAHNRVRGLAAPAGPGCWTLLDLGDGKPPVRAKLLTTTLAPADSDATPTGGSGPISRDLELHGKALRLTCADGSTLEVRRLTLPGKKPVDAKSFWNGLNGRTARWVAAAEVE